MKKFLLNLLEDILTFPAKKILLKFKPKVIAITGSVGKTSAKEAVYFLLSNVLSSKIIRSKNSLNTKFGIPLAVLGFSKAPVSPNDSSITNLLWIFYIIVAWVKFPIIYFSKKYPEILVIEISADKPGDIKKICNWLDVDIAVYTQIAPAHLEYFKDTKGVFEEKKALAESLTKDGILILNRKDPWSSSIQKSSKAKAIYYQYEQFDMANTIAKTVGKIFNVQISEADQILKNFKTLHGRLDKIKIKGITLIDDTYNANPSSTGYALDYLDQDPGKRKIAFLGDMLELGNYESKGHQMITQRARKICNQLILVGENYHKFKKYSDYWYKSAKQAAEALPIKMKKGDVILVKGSRSMTMEIIIDKLKQILERN